MKNLALLLCSIALGIAGLLWGISIPQPPTTRTIPDQGGVLFVAMLLKKGALGYLGFMAGFFAGGSGIALLARFVAAKLRLRGDERD